MDGIGEKSVCQGILRKIIGIAPRSSSFMDTQWWKPLPGKTFSSFSRSQFRHFQKTPKFRAAPIAIDMQALEKAEADAEQSKPTQERNLAAGQPGKPQANPDGGTEAPRSREEFEYSEIIYDNSEDY